MILRYCQPRPPLSVNAYRCSTYAIDKSSPGVELRFEASPLRRFKAWTCRNNGHVDTTASTLLHALWRSITDRSPVWTQQGVRTLPCDCRLSGLRRNVQAPHLFSTGRGLCNGAARVTPVKLRGTDLNHIPPLLIRKDTGDQPPRPFRYIIEGPRMDEQRPPSASSRVDVEQGPLIVDYQP